MNSESSYIIFIFSYLSIYDEETLQKDLQPSSLPDANRKGKLDRQIRTLEELSTVNVLVWMRF